MSAAERRVPGVGVNGPGDAARRAWAKPPPTRAPADPGANGFWVIQVKPGPPLGWVLSRSRGNAPSYHCYAYCRDQENRRPWLREFATLNSAVAWMLQLEPEIRDLISRCDPEPAT